MATRKNKVVGVAGMPGAGKATIRKIVQKMGYPVVVMGDVIREEAERRKLEPTPENLGWIMLELRKKEGPAVVAKRCISKIKDVKERLILIDGVRSLHEVKELKQHFPKFTILAIHASPEKRFQRLIQRSRSDDPRTWENFIKRDLRELGIGLGDVIATANYMIINEGAKEQLRREVYKLFEGVVGK